MKKVLKKLGFYNYSKFMESSMTEDNIRAISVICILSVLSSVLFLAVSVLNEEYNVKGYRITAIVNMIISLAMYTGVKMNRRNIALSFHRFHAVMFLYILWLTVYGMFTSIVDSLNRGGFISFLITQVWAYDLIFIPPFVSVLFCGISFSIFLGFISHFMYFPFAKYVECMIFYVTICTVNYFHYQTAVARLNQQEEVLNDNTRLDILSTTDALTHVNNRTALRQRAAEYDTDTLFVMMIDIDDFKKYNDTYGHQEGDKVLDAFAHILTEEFGSENVYRYGGDEFLVMMKDITEDDFKEKIVHANWIFGNMNPDNMEKPTSSFGYVYGKCHSEEDLIELVKSADEELYQAKASGKNKTYGTAYHQI